LVKKKWKLKKKKNILLPIRWRESPGLGGMEEDKREGKWKSEFTPQRSLTSLTSGLIKKTKENREKTSPLPLNKSFDRRQGDSEAKNWLLSSPTLSPSSSTSPMSSCPKNSGNKQRRISPKVFGTKMVHTQSQTNLSPGSQWNKSKMVGSPTFIASESMEPSVGDSKHSTASPGFPSPLSVNSFVFYLIHSLEQDLDPRRRLFLHKTDYYRPNPPSFNLAPSKHLTANLFWGDLGHHNHQSTGWSTNQGERVEARLWREGEKRQNPFQGHR
jgi:hypothetical protein